MMIDTVEWGRVHSSSVKTVTCPTCWSQVLGRLSDDGKRIEIPSHGKTPELECRSKGWHDIVPQY